MYSMLSHLALMIGGPRLEKRVLDLGRSATYGRRLSRHWTRRGIYVIIPWTGVLVWVVTAFYRATARKDDLIAEQEERARAVAGSTDQS